MSMTKPRSDDGPWFVSFILQVGVPAAIALFLVWLTGLRLERTVAANAEVLKHMQQEMDSAQVVMARFADQNQENSDRQLRVLRQICVAVTELAERESGKREPLRQSACVE